MNQQFIRCLWAACARAEDGSRRAPEQHAQGRITVIMISIAIIGKVSTMHAELLISAPAVTVVFHRLRTRVIFLEDLGQQTFRPNLDIRVVEG